MESRLTAAVPGREAGQGLEPKTTAPDFVNGLCLLKAKLTAYLLQHFFLSLTKPNDDHIDQSGAQISTASFLVSHFYETTRGENSAQKKDHKEKALTLCPGLCHDLCQNIPAYCKQLV